MVVMLVNLVVFHIQNTVPNAKVGFSKAMSAGWIYIDKAAEGGPRVFRKVCHLPLALTFLLPRS